MSEKLNELGCRFWHKEKYWSPLGDVPDRYFCAKCIKVRKGK